MTDGIIETVNSMVRPNDYLFYAGDWSLNTTTEKFEQDTARFNCQNIFMLWGNHNCPVRKVYDEAVGRTVASQLNGDVKNTSVPDERWRGKVEVYPLRYKNVIFCGDYMELIVDGLYICMFHYPIDVFNHVRTGAVHLCGHSHYSYEKTRASNTDSKRLDLSWDGHKKPLSINDIKSIMATKNTIKLDHH
jgi:calcineurin-like phosphoesterase family protein